MGAAIAGILGGLALLLGIQARRNGRGMGAIVTGALALVLAVILTMSCIGLVNALKTEAEKLGTAPLVVKCADKPYLGLLGFAISATQLDVNNKELEEQLKAMLKAVNGDHTAATAKPASESVPAAETAPAENSNL